MSERERDRRVCPRVGDIRRPFPCAQHLVTEAVSVSCAFQSNTVAYLVYLTSIFIFIDFINGNMPFLHKATNP